jgi:chromosome segregation ATPase
MTAHRSAVQIANEKMAVAIEAQRKAARQALADHPQVEAIDNLIAEEQKSIVTARRHFADAPAKIQNFENRAQEWKDRMDSAETLIEATQETIAALRTRKDAIIDNLMAQAREEQAGN